MKKLPSRVYVSPVLTLDEYSTYGTRRERVIICELGIRQFFGKTPRRIRIRVSARRSRGARRIWIRRAFSMLYWSAGYRDGFDYKLFYKGSSDAIVSSGILKEGHRWQKFWVTMQTL